METFCKDLKGALNKCGTVQLFSSRVDVAILLSLLGAMFIQGCLFLLNIPCSPWPMWIVFSGVAIVLAINDVRAMARFAILTAICLTLTAFTYSYTGTDAMAYHFPMQDLLRGGWNPTKVATIEAFHEMMGNLSLSQTHTLFLPRLNALCGALVGLSTGLFVADSFFNYALVFVLLTTAYDFSRRIWLFGRLMSALFAFSITCTTKFTAFLSGYVDYLTYAGILIMLMASALYLREHKNSDLIVLAAAILVSTLAKSTGFIISALLFVSVLPVLWKDHRFWYMCVSVAIYVVIVGYSPLITSWLNYGCPLYPTMSWSAAHPPIDITSDFTGNADALSMGYVARTLYAWVSPALTVRMCALINGNPDFNPVFTVCGGVAGFGSVFRIMLLLSLIALIASKKNIVTVICVFIFVTTLVAPLKYIGFSRYFLQIWAIPSLALFNLAAFPIYKPQRQLFAKALQLSYIAVPVLIAALCMLRTLAFNGRSLAIEAARQQALAGLKKQSDTWQIGRKNYPTYSLAKRMKVAGINCIVTDEPDPKLPTFSYDSQYMWAVTENARDNAIAVDEEFFIADSVGALLRFPWRKAYSLCPDILWYGF